MTSVKVKFRPSTVTGKMGSIYLPSDSWTHGAPDQYQL